MLLKDAGIAVATSDGALALHEIQLAGKKAISPESFCNGYPDFIGSVLGQAG
jgi:methionyl-tRNA formyltransferase